MKLFEVKNIFEAREEQIAQSMGDKIIAAAQQDLRRTIEDPLQIVKQLSQANPKYIQWIVNMYVVGQFKLEDIPQIKKELQEFNRVKQKLDKKDINQYKNLPDLYTALKPFQDHEVISKRQQDKIERQGYFERGEIELIHKDNNITVVSPHSEEASCYFGMGTKWCTSGDNDNLFDPYYSAGNLFIIFTKEGAYQLHYADQDSANEDDYDDDEDDDEGEYDDRFVVFQGEYSFMDAQDQSADFKAVAKRYPVLDKLFRKFAIERGIGQMVDINTVSEEEKATMIAKDPQLIEDLKNPSPELQRIVMLHHPMHGKNINNPTEETKKRYDEWENEHPLAQSNRRWD